jgi:hypothetical protein
MALRDDTVLYGRKPSHLWVGGMLIIGNIEEVLNHLSVTPKGPKETPAQVIEMEPLAGKHRSRCMPLRAA